MATTTASTPFDADASTLWWATVTVATATHVQVSNGQFVRDYYGTGFAFDSFGNIASGTVESTTHKYQPPSFNAPLELQYEITGLSHSLVTIRNYYGQNDLQGLHGYIFGGNDHFDGSAGMDLLRGYGGNDLLFGYVSDDVLLGQDGNDTLVGGPGNDTLYGGTGIDSLEGGSGNDLFSIDDASDTAQEAANAGIDMVQSSVAFTLGANIENLTLTGSAAVNGTGNALGNALTGNAAANLLSGGAGNDTLDGGGGNDTLAGGAGNDRYILHLNDTVVE